MKPSTELPDFSDITVTVHYTYGTGEIPLEVWMEQGPGLRYLRRPSAAKKVSTGECLPLSIIPLRYRNNRISRFLISIGVLTNPWE